jgi:hypothetical protein
VLKCCPRVVRWVNEDALDLAGELLFQRLEGQQVVAEDQPVVEEIVIGDPVRGVVRLFRVLQRMRGSSFGRFSLPIQVSSSFGFCATALLSCHFKNRFSGVGR